MTRDQVIVTAILCIIIGLFVGFLAGMEVGIYEVHQRIINNPQGYIDAIVSADHKVKVEAAAKQNLKELESADR